MAGDFKGVSEKFYLNLLHHDGHSERVGVEIGLEGLKILNSSTGTVTKKYDLSHISRWQSRGNQLVLYVRSNGELEERQTTLQGSESTIRSALDTLTCCCMQLAELLQSKQTETAQETANNLHQLIATGGGKKKTASMPAVDDVEYWKKPDKDGWLQCQGEHIKSWRNRWFVLKQGYLFRFMNDKVSASAKPRGVVDLSKVQDVRVVPGKGNMIQLKTSSGGMVQYMAGTETEVVEWVSALEGAIQKICKDAAGIEDEPPKPKASSKPAAGSNSTAELIKQLERSYNASAVGSSSSNTTSASSQRPSGPTMVSILGYDAVGRDSGAPTSSTYGREGSSSFQERDYQPSSTHSPYSNLNRQYSSGYTSIAGAQILGAAPAAGVTDLDLNYGGFGGGRPSAQPSNATQYAPAQVPSSAYAAAPSGYGSGGYSGAAAYGGAAPAATNGSYAQQQGYYSQPPQQQQPQAQQVMQAQDAGVSLIDQVPHQQPTYPYFQHSSAPAPAAPAAGPAAPSAWQTHYTNDGRAYYYNPTTGVTQWEPPVM